MESVIFYIVGTAANDVGAKLIQLTSQPLPEEVFAGLDTEPRERSSTSYYSDRSAYKGKSYVRFKISFPINPSDQKINRGAYLAAGFITTNSLSLEVVKDAVASTRWMATKLKSELDNNNRLHPNTTMASLAKSIDRQQLASIRHKSLLDHADVVMHLMSQSPSDFSSFEESDLSIADTSTSHYQQLVKNSNALDTQNVDVKISSKLKKVIDRFIQLSMEANQSRQQDIVSMKKNYSSMKASIDSAEQQIANFGELKKVLQSYSSLPTTHDYDDKLSPALESDNHRNVNPSRFDTNQSSSSGYGFTDQNYGRSQANSGSAYLDAHNMKRRQKLALAPEEKRINWKSLLSPSGLLTLILTLLIGGLIYYIFFSASTLDTEATSASNKPPVTQALDANEYSGSGSIYESDQQFNNDIDSSEPLVETFEQCLERNSETVCLRRRLLRK